ncbi:unnamed protein product [Mortierella alpina]
MGPNRSQGLALQHFFSPIFIYKSYPHPVCFKLLLLFISTIFVSLHPIPSLNRSQPPSPRPCAHTLSLWTLPLHTCTPALDQLLTTASDLNALLMHNQYFKYQHVQSALNPNRHSDPSSNPLRQQQQVPMQKQQPTLEKLAVAPARGGQRLSLDTSDERLQNITIVKHGNKKYLKLFSPSLVESPVSFLDQKQLISDRKLWENGPDEAFQKQLEVEKREAYRGKTCIPTLVKRAPSVCVHSATSFVRLGV